MKIQSNVEAVTNIGTTSTQQNYYVTLHSKNPWFKHQWDQQWSLLFVAVLNLCLELLGMIQTHTSVYSKRHFFLSLARRDLCDSSHLISKPFKSVFLSKLSARSYLQVGETVKNFQKAAKLSPLTTEKWQWWMCIRVHLVEEKQEMQSHVPWKTGNNSFSYVRIVLILPGVDFSTSDESPCLMSLISPSDFESTLA